MIEILYFGAEWCAPCKTLAPIMKTIADTNLDVSVLKIDIEEDYELSSEYQIRSVPTLLFKKNGVEISRSVGVKSNQEIQLVINNSK